MDQPTRLLNRLAQIAQSLSTEASALALIGLGSVGQELERLDAFSDLDFFVIVKNDSKQHFLRNLQWLERICPLAYQFANTVDGYKCLFADGIFCEFAVFTLDELSQAVFSPGRVVWQVAGLTGDIAFPKQGFSTPSQPPIEWQVGEALTNLYVGLCRERRGERLSAMRFIQTYAVDRILQIAEQQETQTGVQKDLFSAERRFETRHPQMAHLLPEFLQGYLHNISSALAILAYLEQNFTINPTLKQLILKLAQAG
ncbi:MAG TPA: hypothetical protein PK299_15000 [Anaerolineales bacterium]|nr:hypothetical protein [Anaerolineales bacterium]